MSRCGRLWLGATLAVLLASAACTSAAEPPGPPPATPTTASPPPDEPALSPTATSLPQQRPAPTPTATSPPPQRPTPTPRPPATATVEPTATAAGDATAAGSRQPPPGESTRTPQAAPSVTSDRKLAIPTPPDRDPFDLARRLRPADFRELQNAQQSSSTPVSEGDVQRFWVLLDAGGTQIDAVARRVSENAYWFFDERVSVAEDDLDRAVREFEEAVWPTVTGLFGGIQDPGIDGDHRMTILHTTLQLGAAGYFSGADAYPEQIRDFSNEREIIYMSTDHLDVGSRGYMATLAHELQHAIHFAGDIGEDAWINEGLSSLATELAGYRNGASGAYLRQPDTQLNSWPDGENTGSSYGAALLFSEYLIDHYGGDESLANLVSQPADGLDGVDAYLESLGFQERAREVFADWLIANYLDEDSGRYGYPGRDLRPISRQHIVIDRVTINSVEQFGADYYSVALGEPNLRITFEGDTAALLFPAAPASGAACWWSNAGDSIDTTLTRELDLTGLDQATLHFAAWYSIEEEWDYAYVEVSMDGGDTWDILPARTTTTRNPNGTGYGAGFTGKSGGWIQEEVDLSPYAGSRVLLRFEYVTDDAVNLHGLCLDDFRIPQLDWADDAEAEGGWIADGFARLGNEIPQEWLVQVIRKRSERPAEVIGLPVGEDGAGELLLNGVDPAEDIVVVVSAVSQHSIIAARYTLTFEGIQ